MQNPWLTLPESEPFVLPQDSQIVDAYAKHYADFPNLKLQTHLMAEPYHGSPDAPVCILSLNPGFSEHDHSWHVNSGLSKALRGNLNHQKCEYPFVFLDPAFRESPGGKWWTKKLRHVIAEIGLEKTAASFFNVELFPYHSKNFRRIPKHISSNHLVPSSNYSAFLVRQFIDANRLIVVFRSKRHWIELVPELANYPALMVTNNSRNPTISNRNLNGYDELITHIA